MKKILDEDVKIYLDTEEEINNFLKMYPEDKDTEITIRLNLEEIQSYLYNYGVISKKLSICLINLPFNIRIKLLLNYLNNFLKNLNNNSTIYNELYDKYVLLQEIKTSYNLIKDSNATSSSLKEDVQKAKIKLLRKEYLEK